MIHAREMLQCTVLRYTRISDGAPEPGIAGAARSILYRLRGEE